MRIISGKYKGRTLLPFENIGVRPTSDKARESLFDILRDKVVGKTFLDLYSGTGAIGIEALSRGAKEVTLNDNSLLSVNLIKRNIEKLKIDNGINVLNYDGIYCLIKSIVKYDIIFIDPPYQSELLIKSIENCGNALNENGIIIGEDEKPLPEIVGSFNRYDMRKYGRAYLGFYSKMKE